MKKKLIIAFVIFTMIGVGLFYFLTIGDVGVQYNTIEVISGSLGKSVEETGRISSKNIRAYYGDGVLKIGQLPVALGDEVKKGQLLLEFDSTMDLEIQRVLKQIEALEASYNDAQSGTDMENVSSARIEISKIRNELALATKEKERTQILFDSGAVSKVTLEESLNTEKDLQSDLSIAQNTYNKLAKGISENERAKYEAEIDVLLLSLEILEKDKEKTAVYADIDGLVTEVNTFVGDKPLLGTKILELQDPAEKIVLIDFMVEDASDVKKGLSAELKDLNLGIYLEDLKVSQVYPKAFVALSELSVRENRQWVELTLPTTEIDLPFGLEVETRVMIEEPRQALVVPIGAVFYKEGNQVVKVLEKGSLVERAIETGVRSDGNIEILAGLEEGEEVLANYQED